ncbi:MAG: hypothetical protein LKM40_06050 [Mageeibacillus sp.]|jgi:membrane protease YdiL (CAAX protease family)|nr:hypothetical protein [Mageeibacillus sp.]
MDRSKLSKVAGGALSVFRAAIALCLFIFSDFIVYFIFDISGIDTDVYNGLCTTLSAVATIIIFAVYNILSGRGGSKIIKTRRLSALELCLIIVVALGLLGFVDTYLSIAGMISDYFESLKNAIKDYSQSVDRYADVDSVKVPVWDNVLYTLSMFILIPVREELIFRGAVFGELEKGFKPGCCGFPCIRSFWRNARAVCSHRICLCLRTCDHMLLLPIRRASGQRLLFILYSTFSVRHCIILSTAIISVYLHRRADAISRNVTFVMIAMMVPAVIAFVRAHQDFTAKKTRGTPYR